MNNQKGQAQLILFALIFIVIVWFFALSEKEKSATPEPESTSQPVFQEEAVISSPEETQEKTPISPIPVPDNYPPYRFNGQPSGGLPAETRKAWISLETNEQAVCRHGTVAGLSYYSMNHIFSNTDSTYHYTQVTGLSEGEGYVYYIKCADTSGNANTDDFLIYFSVKKPEDLTPPVRSNQYPAGEVLHYDTTNTMIGISTNEPAYCRYSLQQGTSYSSMRYKLTDDGTMKYHTAKISGLAAGQLYNYFVRCQDLEGNVNTGDVMISFSVGE